MKTFLLFDFLDIFVCHFTSHNQSEEFLVIHQCLQRTQEQDLLRASAVHVQGALVGFLQYLACLKSNTEQCVTFYTSQEHVL